MPLLSYVLQTASNVGLQQCVWALQQHTVEAALQASLELDVYILHVYILRGAVDQPVGPFGQLNHYKLVLLFSFWAHELISIAMSRCGTARCSA
jgi:hypothetical protein